MSSGSVLDDCQQVRACCCCLPLRIGSMYIALFGAAMAALGVVCILLTEWDQSHVQSIGLSGDFGRIVLFVFAIMNFMLLLASISLFIGAWKRNNVLVTVYVWFLIVYLLMLAKVLILTLVSCMLAEDKTQNMVMFLFGWILLVIILVHFFLVTNSYRMRTL